MGKVWSTLITLGTVLFIGAMAAGVMVVTKTGFIVIDGWEVGVQKDGTTYNMVEVQPGYHLFAPVYTTIEDINARPIMFNYSKSDAKKESTHEIRYSPMITGVDKNGIPLSFAIAFNIKPKKDQMAEMFQATGSYENALDKTAIQPNKSIIKDVMGAFDAKLIQSKRNEVSKMLNELFEAAYADHQYFTLEGAVDLKEIDLPKKIQDGQILVQLEAQEAEKAENAKKRMKAQAEGIAGKNRIEAQGRADAITIEATAKAKANKLLSSSITDKILAYDTIEAWKLGGAQVPNYVGSEKSQFIMNMKQK